MKKLIVVISLILAQQGFTTERTCSGLFPRGEINEKYHSILQTKPKTINDLYSKPMKIVQLLNLTFSPIISKLSLVTSQYSKTKISSILKEKAAIPVQKANYLTTQGRSMRFYQYADILGAEKDSPNLTEIQNMLEPSIKHNVDKAVNSFGLGPEGHPMQRRRIRNRAVDDAFDIYKPYQEFLWSSAPTEYVSTYGGAHLVLGSIITPIGFYGGRFAETLMRTTQIMMEIAHKNLQAESRKAYDSASDLLVENTARARGAVNMYETSNVELTPLSATIEGISSFHQLIGTVMGQQLPGINDGTSALREFIFNGGSKAGLTSELTLQFPMGLIGPMALSGHFFNHPIIRDENGRLVISEKIKEQLKFVRGDEKKRKVCPMALFFNKKSADGSTDVRTTGLQELAESYWKVFQIVDAQMKREAGAAATRP